MLSCKGFNPVITLQVLFPGTTPYLYILRSICFSLSVGVGWSVDISLVAACSGQSGPLMCLFGAETGGVAPTKRGGMPLLVAPNIPPGSSQVFLFTSLVSGMPRVNLRSGITWFCSELQGLHAVAGCSLNHKVFFSTPTCVIQRRRFFVSGGFEGAVLSNKCNVTNCFCC